MEERKYKHIVELSMPMTAYASLPFKYWDEARFTSVYLINRLTIKIHTNQFPFEIIFHALCDWVLMLSLPSFLQ